MARRKKQNEEEQENLENTNNDADDTFGLPEVEYEPLKRDEPQAEETVREETIREETTYTTREETPEENRTITEEVHEEVTEEDPHEYRSTYSYMEEEKPVWPKVLGGIIILLVAGAIIWFFAVYQPKQKEEAEKARREELARVEAARKKEEERLAELKLQEEEQRRLDSLANVPKVGQIETLNARTGRYYVVVASAIDDDLLLDFANKLIKKGTSCTLIPPFGKHKFYRLAVDSKESYDEAQTTANGMKGGDFADQIWVVKY